MIVSFWQREHKSSNMRFATEHSFRLHRGQSRTRFALSLPSHSITHCHARESGHLVTHKQKWPGRRDSRFHGNDKLVNNPLCEPAKGLGKGIKSVKKPTFVEENKKS